MARRIVVVGGGVIGCSVAWHLACRGAGEIVLVERDRLGAGTTWHSAGNILWNPIDMHDLPILYMLDEVIPKVTAESEQETGWLETGRLFLAHTQRTLESFTAQAEEGARRGFVSRMLESHEIPRHHPLLDPGVLTGAWLNGKVGRLNPADLTAAYARAARKRGVTILEQRNVLGIETRGERVTGVATDQGSLAADTVVVCCGLWSRRLLEPLGLALGQWGCEHFYVIARTAQRLPRETPSFVSADDLIYGREEVGGMLFGAFDEDAVPLEGGVPPNDFAFSLLPDNWEKFGPYAERAAELFPSLKEAPIQRFVNGPETFTPDGKPLMGPVAGIDGLLVASAFNSGGVSYSGLAGAMIADMVGGSAPRFDPAAYDPGRFGARTSDQAWMRQRISGTPSSHYREVNG
ncbi:MAG: FAD-binding oxidoreductase [Proteobacteria bacterium]|nr:FAD-binding oxidoreductase [Pseudomonadota bacterium]